MLPKKKSNANEEWAKPISSIWQEKAS